MTPNHMTVDSDETELLEPEPLPAADDIDDPYLKRVWEHVEKMMPEGQFAGTDEELEDILGEK